MTIIIVTAYADTEEKHLVLNNQIKYLKSIPDIDVLFTTHIFPIAKLDVLPDYIIYDKTNPVFDPNERSTVYWEIFYYGETFDIKLNKCTIDYGFTPFNLIISAFNFLKNYKQYNKIFILNYDAVITKEILNAITTNTGYLSPVDLTLNFFSINRNTLQNFIDITNKKDYVNFENAESYFKHITNILNFKYQPNFIVEDTIHYPGSNNTSNFPLHYSLFQTNDFKYYIYDVKTPIKLYNYKNEFITEINPNDHKYLSEKETENFPIKVEISGMEPHILNKELKHIHTIQKIPK